jgi:hypothetical protein
MLHLSNTVKKLFGHKGQQVLRNWGGSKPDVLKKHQGGPYVSVGVSGHSWRVVQVEHLLPGYLQFSERAFQIFRLGCSISKVSANIPKSKILIITGILNKGYSTYSWVHSWSYSVTFPLVVIIVNLFFHACICKLPVNLYSFYTSSILIDTSAK